MANKIIQLKDGNDNTFPISAEEGTNYIKFPNGVLIQWGSVDKTINFNVQWGGLYYGEASNVLTFPIAFTSRPYATQTLDGIIPLYLRWNETSIILSGALRDVLGTASIRINWLAIGRWK